MTIQSIQSYRPKPHINIVN